MDPDATWAIVIDENADRDERDAAALELLVWLARGGGPPKAAPGLRPCAESIERCEMRLWAALDDGEGL